MTFNKEAETFGNTRNGAFGSSLQLSSWQTALISLSTGLIVANLYYGQPLASTIAGDTGIPPYSAGLIVTLTQIGFGLGLIFLVPLADIAHPRRLISITLVGASLALCAMAASSSSFLLLAGALFVGAFSTATQMLLPLAARLAPSDRRGQIIGRVMAGLLLGIVGSRPIAGLVADNFGWRAIFEIASIAMLVLAFLLYRWLPSEQRRVAESMPYTKLLTSMGHILFKDRVLRTCILLHTPLFASFTLFWTAVPVHLAHELGLSNSLIGLFTLASASGAFAAPIMGRLADAGRTRSATMGAVGCVLMAYLLAWSQQQLWTTLLAAVLLDFGVQSNLILAQRAIYSIGEGLNSRKNGVFMSLFFVGGAFGSAISTPLIASHGWSGVACVGFGMAMLALIVLLFKTLRTAPNTHTDTPD